MPRDYGDASSDDLSSEWDSDVPDVRHESGTKVSRGLEPVSNRKRPCTGGRSGDDATKKRDAG